MLALAPIGRDVSVARRGIRSTQIAELLPQVWVDPMDCAVEPPCRRFVQGPRLHRLHASRIPQDRVGPVPAQFPDIFAHVSHIGCPLSNSHSARLPALAPIPLEGGPRDATLTRWFCTHKRGSKSLLASSPRSLACIAVILQTPFTVI